MRSYKCTDTNYVLEGEFTWIQFLLIPSGSIISLDDNGEITLLGLTTLPCPRKDGKVYPWKKLRMTSGVQCILGERQDQDMLPQGSGFTQQTDGTALLALMGQGDRITGLEWNAAGQLANATITTPFVNVSKYKELYIVSAVDSSVTSISAFLRWSIDGITQWGITIESGNIGGAVSFQQPSFNGGNKIQVFTPYMAIRYALGPAGPATIRTYIRGFVA